MKKNRNLFLFLALVALTVFVYIFEEKGQEKKKSLHDQAISLYNAQTLGQLEKITYPKYEVDLKKKLVGEQSLPLDEVKLNEFFKYLSSLKIKRLIYPEEVHEKMIPKDALKLIFHFTNGQLVFTLGAKLGFSKDFYIKVEDSTTKDDSKLVVAYSDMEYEGIYHESDIESSDINYRRFLTLFSLNEEFFYNTKVFGTKTKINQVWIKTFRSPGFSLNRLKPSIPKLFSSLKVDTQRVEKFFRELETFMGNNLYKPIDKKLLKNKLLSFYINDDSSKQYYIYSAYGSLKGYFIYADHLQHLIEFTKEQTLFLFYPQQYYWVKSVYPDWKSLPGNEVGLYFKSSKKNLSFKYKAGHKFQATQTKVDKPKALKHQTIKNLLSLLVKEADFVSLFDGLDKNLINESSIKLSMHNLEYALYLNKAEIVLIDKARKLKYHFLLFKNESIEATYKDYFLDN